MRITEIIISELMVDNLKAQEDLEFAINKSTNTETKVNDVKDLLAKLVLNELMMNKFLQLFKITESKTDKPNGTV